MSGRGRGKQSEDESLLGPPSFPLDTENPEKEQAGAWERSYVLEGVVRHPPPLVSPPNGGLGLWMKGGSKRQ